MYPLSRGYGLYLSCPPGTPTVTSVRQITVTVEADHAE